MKKSMSLGEFIAHCNGVELNTNDTGYLTLRPRFRRYTPNRDGKRDCVYDWSIGHQFVVTTKRSPFYGDVLTVTDSAFLLNGHLNEHMSVMLQYSKDKFVEVTL